MKQILILFLLSFTMAFGSVYIDGEKQGETGGGGSVSSVFGRTGSVTATSGDYTSDKILYSNTSSGLSSTNTKLAIDEVTELTKTNGFGIKTLPSLSVSGTSIVVGNDGIIIFNTSTDGSGKNVTISVTQGAILTPTDNVINYLYCRYNNGSPYYALGLDSSIFFSDASYVAVARVTREGSILHFEEYDAYGVALSNKMLYKDIVTHGFERVTGLTLSTSGTRVVTISSGTVFFGVQRWDLVDNISGTSGNMYEYYKVGGNWTRSASLNLYDSIYYSDGTNRQLLGSNKYVAKYFYRDVGEDNEIYYTHGGEFSKLSEALAEPVPTAPPILMAHTIYIGKIIVQQNATIGVAYNRDWGQGIQNASITSHEDLTNIYSAGSGVTNGHISDNSQTIYGTKTFANDVLISSLTGSSIVRDTSVKNSLENIDGLHQVSKELTGFSDPSATNIAYDSGTRKVTISGTFTAYWRGKPISALTSGWVSDAHDAINGTWFLYYNGTTFVWSQTSWTFDMLQIAIVYYGASDKYALKETHGLMQWQVHSELHSTIGTYKTSGGDLSNYTLGSNTATNRRPYVAETTIVDEDCPSTLSAHTSQLYTKLYLSSTSTAVYVQETAEIVPVSGNQPYYNQFTGGNWQQTLMSPNQYQAIWLVAVPTSSDANSAKFRYLWVQGQSEGSLSTIQALVPASITLPISSPEIVFLQKIIILYTASNWVITSVNTLTGTRYSQTSSVAGNFLSSVTSDGTLTGAGTAGSPLSVNYATDIAITSTTSAISTVTGAFKVAGGLGVAGDAFATTMHALTVQGGTNASETLTLNSTSHATKGKIYFGASSAYNESSVRWGFNTTAPSYLMDVNGDACFRTNIYGSGSSSGRLNLRGNSVNLTSGGINVLDTLNSTSTTSGALIVSGGVGIAGDTYSAGDINLNTGKSVKIAGNVVSNQAKLSVAMTVGEYGELYHETSTGAIAIRRLMKQYETSNLEYVGSAGFIGSTPNNVASCKVGTNRLFIAVCNSNGIDVVAGHIDNTIHRIQWGAVVNITSAAITKITVQPSQSNEVVLYANNTTGATNVFAYQISVTDVVAPVCSVTYTQIDLLGISNALADITSSWISSTQHLLVYTLSGGGTDTYTITIGAGSIAKDSASYVNLASGNNLNLQLAQLSSTSFILGYLNASGYPTVIAGTINPGSAITKGSAVISVSTAYNATGIIKLSSSKFGFSYNKTANPGYTRTCVGTVSGNTITLGVENTAYMDATGVASIAHIKQRDTEDEDFFTLYTPSFSSTLMYMRYMSVSGTTPTYKTMHNFGITVATTKIKGNAHTITDDHFVFAGVSGNTLCYWMVYPANCVKLLESGNAGDIKAYAIINQEE